jgi:hypothetical protein
MAIIKRTNRDIIISCDYCHEKYLWNNGGIFYCEECNKDFCVPCWEKKTGKSITELINEMGQCLCPDCINKIIITKINNEVYEYNGKTYYVFFNKNVGLAEFTEVEPYSPYKFINRDKTDFYFETKNIKIKER